MVFFKYGAISWSAGRYYLEMEHFNIVLDFEYVLVVIRNDDRLHKNGIITQN